MKHRQSDQQPKQRSGNGRRTLMQPGMYEDVSQQQALLPVSETPMPKYLLVKGLPSEISEEAVRAVFHDLVSIKTVHLCPKSKNVYISLEDPAELCRFIAKNEKKARSFNSQTLRISKVSKVPLDLNEDSLVVLLTIYDPKITIDVHFLHRFLFRWGNAAKIAIYRKKDYQAFVEFRDLDTANRFVEEADNQVFHGLFRLRVKFTRKDHLVIKTNSNLEFDFLRAEAQSGWPDNTMPPHNRQRLFSAEENWEYEPRFGQLPQRQFGMVSSYQNFETQHSRHTIQKNKRHPSMSQSSFPEPHDWERHWDEELPRHSNEDMDRQGWHSGYGYDDRSHSFHEPPRYPDSQRPLNQIADRRQNPMHENWYDSEDSKFSDPNSKPKVLKSPSLSHNPSQQSFQATQTAPLNPSPDSLIKDAPMHAIVVSNVPPEMSCKHLFNLFSLYGNIPRLYLNRDRHKAFVLYSSELEQKNAFFYLKNVSAFQAKLALQTTSKWSPEFDEKNTVYQSFKSSLHFSPDKYPERARVITGPAPALYVFNLTDDLNLPLLKRLFEKLCPVLQIEYSNESHVSALVYFENTERATTALCSYKNFKMLVRGLKINFANEQKAWQKAQPHVVNRWRSLGVVPRALEERANVSRKTSGLLEDEEAGYEEEAKDTVQDPVEVGVAKTGKRRFSRMSTASGDRLGSD